MSERLGRYEVAGVGRAGIACRGISPFDNVEGRMNTAVSSSESLASLGVTSCVVRQPAKPAGLSAEWQVLAAFPLLGEIPQTAIKPDCLGVAPPHAPGGT